MGYGGAPPWVYKNEMAAREMSHYNKESSLQSEIQDLKKENATLKARIVELEEEISNLRKYKFDSLSPK